jgi:hypothetical protein
LGWVFVAVYLAKTPDGIAIIWPKIVPPLADAVSLVKDPKADPSTVERSAYRRISELLRRDQQHAGVAIGYLVERLLPMQRRQCPIHGDTGIDTMISQKAVTLICHQGDEGRDHHCQVIESRMSL